MEILSHLVDFIIHLDHHLDQIIRHYGTWTYLIVFLIVFCETGLVVTPFLPGDSLLFVLGAFAAMGMLDIWIVAILLTLAAILGDSVNYLVGHKLSPRVFRHEEIKFIKREYLERTQRFYEKYGGKTIIIARFVPIIRTFAPFMAGVGDMRYSKFLFYNVLGAILWVSGIVSCGYFFGNIPIIKENFSSVVYLIIFISILPAIIEILRHRKKGTDTFF